MCAAKRARASLRRTSSFNFFHSASSLPTSSHTRQPSALLLPAAPTPGLSRIAIALGIPLAVAMLYSLVPLPLPFPSSLIEPRTKCTKTSSAGPQMDEPTLADRDALSKRESGVTDSSPMRVRMENLIKEKQKEIIKAIEKIDGSAFKIDAWDRPSGGGGISCVLQDGNVFEKAGVNTSVVYGKLPRPAILRMRADHKALDPDVESLDFFAAGLSVVMHPANPMAPTVHFNYRYFETANPDGSSNAWWYGGGCDLTPSYLFDEDAIHFHKTIKVACDKHDKAYYPRFKKWCDEYFFNRHRGEARGVGGIFFDDLDETEKDREQLFAFVSDCLGAFLPQYMPIIERRKDMPFTEKEKQWQKLRRGRYVEFNLVYDRGTSFGLNTPNARVESILMSLPLEARWQYMHTPEKGSREERCLQVLKTPIEWV